MFRGPAFSAFSSEDQSRPALAGGHGVPYCMASQRTASLEDRTHRRKKWDKANPALSQSTLRKPKPLVRSMTRRERGVMRSLIAFGTDESRSFERELVRASIADAKVMMTTNQSIASSRNITDMTTYYSNLLDTWQ